MSALLLTFSWPELRHHPWRSLTAVVAVAVGVALAWAVHLINQSALEEFAGATRAVNGEPDVELRDRGAGFDDHLLDRLAAHPAVRSASPVLEVATYALAPGGEQRSGLRVLGVDALMVVRTAPALMPLPDADADRLALFAPDSGFANPAARALAGPDGTLRLQTPDGVRRIHLRGHVTAGGPALVVMDIGAAQDLFGRTGLLTRLDLRLQPGVDRAAFVRDLALPPTAQVADAQSAGERLTQLSRAYRVNLTVLALVALFTGAYLVFSVLSLGVARRAPQLALLGVLGLTPGGRLRLVLAESALLGLIGTALGLAGGLALAALALRQLGGDLGGGFFAGVSPSLRWSLPGLLAYAALGLAAALAGGWWPARAAARLPPARTLKGQGLVSEAGTDRGHGGRGPALMALGALLALLPPLGSLPLAAYLSVGLLLVGGIASLPPLVEAVCRALQPAAGDRLLAQLALARTRRSRHSATVAVGGVVAALALAVALTVMVASFRGSVSQWLDRVLPADLYARTARSAQAADAAFLPPGLPTQVAAVDGVRAVQVQRLRSLELNAGQPPVTLIARDLGDAATELPLLGPSRAAPAGQTPVWISETLQRRMGWSPGQPLEPLSKAFEAIPSVKRSSSAMFFIAGVWRDYARANGAIVIRRADYEALTGDARINDLALWLAPGADAAAVQARVRELAARASVSGELPLEFAAAAQVREASLQIFDRSFAVTVWLQAVAIGIGLFGVAASFAAQVLARRKEFGLLRHLGLTRAQVLRLVAAEGAAWSALGAAAGLALGLAVSVVLVHVVNPQSFHWTMDLAPPWARLVALCAAVAAAGTLTAWLAGRSAASAAAVMAVKEDW
jgi:putative ABC transport system permease protein